MRNAKAWATKAWEGYCAERGTKSPDAVKMATYMQDPRAHLAFGLLPKRSLVGPD